MRRPWWAAAAIGTVLAVAIGGAGTEAKAQYSRRTPIVEAVQKTRDGIVTLKVERRGSYGRKEVVGTGVIIDERGYVVTNRHVVASSDRVAVFLADGTELIGKVLTEDARHDLAVVRVQTARKLKALPLGPASDLMVGETVIAVGNPFGYKNTVSTGIVSAVGREISMPTGEVLGDLIQTNASINPGNSGGPLLNINGEVIGITVALREGAQGIAFALNADTVQQVLARHLSAVKISGVRHGLECKEAVAAEGPRRQRVVVAAAGEVPLRPGDEIRRVADRAVSNRFDVERALWGFRPQDRVPVTVVRDGKEVTVALPLANGAAPERVTGRPGTQRPTGGTRHVSGR